MSDTELARLSIFPATPAQKLVSRHRIFNEWGQGYTREQFILREEYLDTLEHASDGKMAIWVLAPRDDPTTLEFKCSCETYKREGAIARRTAENSSSSPLEDVIGYAIASVYTPPPNRSKGYATHMMRLLHWVIAPMPIGSFPELKWGEPPQAVEGHGRAAFSALYSYVGGFYQRCGPGERDGDLGGWEIRDPISTTWDLHKCRIDDCETSASVEWLDDEAVAELWKRDAAAMRRDMREPSFSAGPDSLYPSRQIFFTFFPDMGVGSFLIKRTSIHNEEGTLVSPMNRWGFTITDKPDDTDVTPDALVTWTVDLRAKPPTLRVIRFRATQRTFKKAIYHVFEAAREAGMQRVEIWNLPKQFEHTAFETGGRTAKRSSIYPAFKWYGQEQNDLLEWVFNE